MENQYSDISKAFKVGVCYVDTVNRKICYDVDLAKAIGSDNVELSYDQLMDKLTPEDRQEVKGLLDFLPGSLCNQLNFRINVADVDYLVRVVFNKNGNELHDGILQAFVMFDNYLDTKFKQIEQQLMDANLELDIIKQQRDLVAQNQITTSQVYIDKDYIVQWGNTLLNPLYKEHPYVPGEKCYETAFGLDAPCEMCPKAQMLQTGNVTTGTRIIDGRVVEMTANPALDAKGRLLGCVMRLEDVTQTKEQERQIRDLHRLMDAILNNTPVCLFVKDPNDNFRYRYWNEAMAKHTKIPTKIAIGKTDEELFPRADDVAHFRRDDEELLRQKCTVDFQEDFEDRAGNKITVHTIKTLIPTDDGKLPLILGVSSDVTEFRKIQNELVKAKEQAERNDMSKSQFVANMGHEIRTPINAIVGFAELLTEESLDAEDKREYIDIIQMNNKLLQQLIADILDLSKIEAHMLEFHYEEVNLNMLCNYLVTTYQKRSDLKVPIVFDQSTPQYNVYSDEKRIQQVVTNFLNNALKFTREGEIEIGLILRNESTIEIYVKDSGAGISNEKLPNIFDRFVKLNSMVTGTGLGLAICKNLVEQLGGHIGVESQEGHGSRFWFTLPYGEKNRGQNCCQ